MLASSLGAAPREPLATPVPARLPDVVDLPAPAAVRLEGFLGFRVANNAAQRLAKVDEGPLLAGFQRRPGEHPWIGEHVGKWMHAATLAWSYTGDDALKAKLDRVARALIACQEADGYLGTYVPEKRFGLFPGSDWDVWSHKYNLMGLLTYHAYTGDAAALTCCRRMGDLLLQTFGPGKKSILSAGTHVGMAATSVLEPVVLLYRATGDERYLEFARYLVASWDEPNGPRIRATLLREKSVQKTANGKAYEMLSNLVGLCELARATGDRTLLEPVLIAWQDVVDHRLYVTGSASQGEHFKEDHFLPNDPGAHVSETCVTTTWIQLNSQLLRLTGEARFGDQLERTFYNHLAAAQRPDGAEWCYFTALEGAKPYGPGINCCVSSGPRGMALVPPHAFLRRPGTAGAPEMACVNLLETGRAGLTLDGQDVAFELAGDGTRPGRFTLTIHVERPARFGVQIRTPEWSRPLQATVAGRGEPGRLEAGWTALPARAWQDGDTVLIEATLAGRRILGEHGNAGSAALQFGPTVLAYDEAFNPELGTYRAVGLAETGQEAAVVPRPGLDLGTLFEAPVRSSRKPGAHRATFVLFADAGSQGSRYRVWLPAPGTALSTNASVLDGARESRSEAGNVSGSMVDGDPGTFVVTFNGRPQAEAWFAAQLDAPVEIRRVVYRHGRVFHDGGWFDAGAGKPRIQIQRSRDGSWETVGTLGTYPATTATRAEGLKDGQSFELMLDRAQAVFGVRILGTPASGDNPGQAFASCAELEAFPR